MTTRPLILTGAAIVLAAVVARIAGAGGIETYPRIAMDTDALTLALCVTLPRARADPFCVCGGGRRVADPALRASGLTYRYPEASTDALSAVDLRVETGEFVVMAGRSGSGKSTLLRAACGLVPHFHGGRVEGELEVAGMDASSYGPAELAEVVGLVAQEPETQVVSTTVRAEIELPLELRGVPPAARSRAVEEVSLALAIDALLERTTDTLSGGELQRVALAAALATRPRLVLLDEPTSQLDPVAGDELISLLRRLNEEWGVAVLLGEHRLERCLPAADRVIALGAGSITFDGAPGDSSNGRWTPTPCSPPPAPGCCARPACRRRRASARRAGRSKAQTSCRTSRNRPSERALRDVHRRGGGDCACLP